MPNENRNVEYERVLTMTDTNKTFKKSALLDKLKALLEEKEMRITYTDCEEYRKQGETSVIEEIIELIENV